MYSSPCTDRHEGDAPLATVFGKLLSQNFYIIDMLLEQHYFFLLGSFSFVCSCDYFWASVVLQHFVKIVKWRYPNGARPEIMTSFTNQLVSYCF